MSKDDIVGTWRLIDWWAEQSDGAITRPMCDEPVGLIAYTNDGFMFAQIMRGGRPAHVHPDPMQGTDTEQAHSARAHISYSGRWKIDGARVEHEVIVASFPNWEGTHQVRNFEFVDGALHLSTDPIDLGGNQVVQRLRWVRAGADTP